MNDTQMSHQCHYLLKMPVGSSVHMIDLCGSAEAQNCQKSHLVLIVPLQNSLTNWNSDETIAVSFKTMFCLCANRSETAAYKRTCFVVDIVVRLYSTCVAH